MKIVVVSDLHIRINNDMDFINKVIDSLVKRIQAKTLKNEKVIMIVLGDIIDRGNEKAQEKYAFAKSILLDIQTKLGNCEMFFIPGNHDISSDHTLSDFNQFIRCFPNAESNEFLLENSVFCKVEEGVNLIFTDSNLTRNYKDDGVISIESIKKNLSVDRINIIFMHHPPESQKDGDKAIHNTQALLSTHSDIVFYGHQHGDHVNKDFFKSDTYFHAIGALFVNETDVSNNFALLEVKNGKINYAYRFDFNGVKFVSQILCPEKKDIKSMGLMLDKPCTDDKYLIKNRTYSDKTGLYNLYDIINNNDYIIISGQAGVGKTYEMSRIYFHLSNSEEFFPIWLDMKYADEQRVLYFLDFVRKNTIDNKSVVLLIDGLNETSENDFSNIVTEISASIRGNVQVKVIVSKRQNINMGINGFKEYILYPLNTREITEYSLSRGIDNINDFMTQLFSTRCNSIAKIPFYLAELVDIYKESGRIPSSDKLMFRIVENRLSQNDKDNNTNELLNNEYQVFWNLAKLGFVMQTTQIFSMPNITYTRILLTEKRQLLEKTGLISINNSPISVNFVHDIFREFFIAYYLSEMTIEEVLQVITLPNHPDQIRPSWLNTISFVLRMRTETDLLNWMVDNAPLALCDMEFDGFPIEEKNKFFIDILQKCFNDGVAIHIPFPNVKEIVKYFQSDEVIRFIINKLSVDLKNHELSTICQVLMNVDRNVVDDGSNETIISLLLEKAGRKYPEYIMRFIMKALLNVAEDQMLRIAKAFLPYVQEFTDPVYVGPFFEMVLKTEQCDLFWNDIKRLYLKSRNHEETYYAIRDCFIKICSSLKNVENKIDAIRFLCKDSGLKYIYNSETRIIEVVEQLFQLIDNEDDSILENLLELYLDIQTNIRDCKEIFIPFLSKKYGNTIVLGTLFKIYKSNTFDTSYWCALCEVVKYGMNKELIEEFRNDNIDEKFIDWYSFQIPEESTEWHELNECYFEKYQKPLPRHEVVTWEEKNRLQKKDYFDSLFDQEKYKHLIAQIIDLVGQDTTCADVWKKYFDLHIYDNKTMEMLVQGITWFFKSDIPLTEFIDKNDWDSISELLIMETLYSDDSIAIDESEERYIRNYYDKAICYTNIEDYNNGNRVGWHVKNIVMLIKRFKYKCPDETLLKMLMIPSPVFGDTSTLRSSVLEFVSEKISDERLLRDRIIFNINNVDMEDMVIHTHILYCYNHKINDGVELALKTLHRDTSFASYTAVDYLISQKGEEFVDSHIDSDICDDMLKYISGKLLNNNSNLCSILIAKNKSSGNRWLFLNELIVLNNRYGIQIYLDFIEEHRCVPEIYDKKDELFPNDITSELYNINDISLIDMVSDLIRIAYSDEFSDKGIMGLKDCVNKIVNTYADIDPQKTFEIINQLFSGNERKKDLNTFCHYYLSILQGRLQKNDDVPWDYKKAIQFIESH